MKKLVLALCVLMSGLFFQACDNPSGPERSCYELSISPLVIHMRVGESVIFHAYGGDGLNYRFSISRDYVGNLSTELSTAKFTALKWEPYVTVLTVSSCSNPAISAKASIYIDQK